MQPHTSESWMLEGRWNCTDDLKSERLIQPHSHIIRFHDGIELHGSVVLLSCPSESVFAERPAHPSAPSSTGNHETCRGDVRTLPRTIRPHFRCTQQGWAVADDDREPWSMFYPDFPGLFREPARIVGVGFASHHDFLKNGPDQRPICMLVLTNLHAGIIPRGESARSLRWSGQKIKHTD